MEKNQNAFEKGCLVGALSFVYFILVKMLALWNTYEGHVLLLVLSMMILFILPMYERHAQQTSKIRFIVLSVLILVIGNQILVFTGTNWLFGDELPMTLLTYLPIGVLSVLVFYGARKLIRWLWLMAHENDEELQVKLRKNRALAEKVSSICFGASAFYVGLTCWFLYRCFM